LLNKVSPVDIPFNIATTWGQVDAGSVIMLARQVHLIVYSKVKHHWLSGIASLWVLLCPRVTITQCDANTRSRFAAITIRPSTWGRCYRVYFHGLEVDSRRQYLRQWMKRLRRHWRSQLLASFVMYQQKTASR
jgi:predicted alpha/beta-fold hydrolase